MEGHEKYYPHALAIVLAFNYKLFYHNPIFNDSFINNAIMVVVLYLACLVASGIILYLPSIIIHGIREYLSNTFPDMQKSTKSKINIISAAVVVLVIAAIMTSAGLK